MTPIYQRTLVATVKATTVLEAAADTLAAVQFDAKTAGEVDGDVIAEIVAAHRATLMSAQRLRELSRTERFRRLGLPARQISHAT